MAKLVKEPQSQQEATVLDTQQRVWATGWAKTFNHLPATASYIPNIAASYEYELPLVGEALKCVIDGVGGPLMIILSNC